MDFFFYLNGQFNLPLTELWKLLSLYKFCKQTAPQNQQDNQNECLKPKAAQRMIQMFEFTNNCLFLKFPSSSESLKRSIFHSQDYAGFSSCIQLHSHLKKTPSRDVDISQEKNMAKHTAVPKTYSLISAEGRTDPGILVMFPLSSLYKQD